MSEFYFKMIEKIDNFLETKERILNEKTIWFIYRFLNEESKFIVINYMIDEMIPTEFFIFDNILFCSLLKQYLIKEK